MGNKKLNEQEKLQAVVDYAECHNYTKVARKYGVCNNTIKRIVEEKSDFFNNVNQEKEECAEDVLTHMQKQLGTVNLIIDTYLKRLLDDDMIAKAFSSHNCFGYSYRQICNAQESRWHFYR